MHQEELNYYQHERRSISAHIAEGPHRVLDVGCGAGNFGAYLMKARKAREVCGIELFPQAADQAKSKLNQVLCGNVDSLDLPAIQDFFGGDEFDYVVCADVLEHLVDPWKALLMLAALLRPDGRVVISVPNVRHWSVWLPLLTRGRWDYQLAGIMDRTHLRFFTKATASELVSSAGLGAEDVRPLIGGRSRILARAGLGFFDEFLAIQWVFICRKQA